MSAIVACWNWEINNKIFINANYSKKKIYRFQTDNQEKPSEFRLANHKIWIIHIYTGTEWVTSSLTGKTVEEMAIQVSVPIVFYLVFVAAVVVFTAQNSFCYYTYYAMNCSWTNSSRSGSFPLVLTNGLLWVEQVGASDGHRYISFWLPTFSDPFASHNSGCCLEFNTPNLHINSLGTISPLTCLFTTMPAACWVTL